MYRVGKLARLLPLSINGTMSFARSGRELISRTHLACRDSLSASAVVFSFPPKNHIVTIKLVCYFSYACIFLNKKLTYQQLFLSIQICTKLQLQTLLVTMLLAPYPGRFPPTLHALRHPTYISKI